MVFGKYCSNTLGVVKLQIVNFVLACLGSDWRYSSGLRIVSEFGNFVVRNFLLLREFLIGTPLPIRKNHTIVLLIWCIFMIRQTW